MQIFCCYGSAHGFVPNFSEVCYVSLSRILVIMCYSFQPSATGNMLVRRFVVNQS